MYFHISFFKLRLGSAVFKIVHYSVFAAILLKISKKKRAQENVVIQLLV